MTKLQPTGAAKAEKLDRRVVRTRQMLRDALVALILEKDYDTISVQDITDRADLGRATFYLHYKDKEALLFSLVQGMADELLRELEAEVGTLGPFMPVGGKPPSYIAFQHAYNNRDFYRALLGVHSMAGVGNLVRDHVAKHFTARMEGLVMRSPLTDGVFKPLLPPGLVANFVASTAITLLTWWVAHDFSPSTEEMAFTTQTLIFQGLLGIMNTASASIDY
jgi:AcrR family transcriptional regulator